MAAALKSYAGTVTSTTTIYTVPTGRSAKITLSYLFMSASTSAEFQIGGVTVFEPASSYSVTVGGAGTQALTAHLNYSGQQPVYYLAAGETVVASISGGSPTISYIIGVVEEAV